MGLGWLIKVYVSSEVEEKFRRLAMMVYGYGKGSISKAAEDAFLRWIMQHEAMLKEVNIPEDPVGAIKGMLSNVKKSGVDLQHEARKIIALKATTSI
ncbi:MAG: hypothetical protein QXL52_02190 [Nitrososphaerales archaeon]